MDTQSYDHAKPLFDSSLPSSVFANGMREWPLAGLLWSAGTLAQNRPKFVSDDPLQREPDTQDASKVQEWDIRPARRPDDESVQRGLATGGERSRGEYQYDRRGSRLELVHEPDLHARRHDRRDHQGTQHVGRPGQGQVDHHPTEISRRLAGVHDSRRKRRGLVHLVRCARQSSRGDGGRRRSRRGCSGLSVISRSRATSSPIRPEDIVIGDTAMIRGARQAPADAAR